MFTIVCKCCWNIFSFIVKRTKVLVINHIQSFAELHLELVHIYIQMSISNSNLRDTCRQKKEDSKDGRTNLINHKQHRAHTCFTRSKGHSVRWLRERNTGRRFILVPVEEGKILLLLFISKRWLHNEYKEKLWKPDRSCDCEMQMCEVSQQTHFYTCPSKEDVRWRFFSLWDVKKTLQHQCALNNHTRSLTQSFISAVLWPRV